MKITELQKDLAATFRWTARLNMNEGVANHFSACVPGKSNEFYVNKKYKVRSEKKSYSSSQFSDYLIKLCKKFIRLCISNFGYKIWFCFRIIITTTYTSLSKT